MPKPNARLTLRLSPVTSNMHPERYMSLVIEDAESHQRVVSFELLGDDLLELLAGRTVGSVDGVDAWLIESRDRPTLGRRRFTTARHFSDDSEDAVRTWARRNGPPLGAHEYQVNRTNGGTWRVVFVYYALANTDAHVAEVAKIKQDTMDVLPSPSSES